MKGTGADEHYWAALKQGRLEMQQCSGCQRWHWPALWRCGDCGSWEHQWHPVALKGKIFTWTRTWHQFGSAPELGLPFVAVVIELDDADGRRVMGTLAGNTDNVKIGIRVSGKIENLNIDGEPLPSLRWTMHADAAGTAS